MAHLLFEAAAASSSPHLVFGEDYGLRTVQFSGLLAAPGGTITLAVPATAASFAGTLAAPSGVVTVRNTRGVPDLFHSGSALWRQGADGDVETSVDWSEAARLEDGQRVVWGQAAKLDDDKRVTWAEAAKLDDDKRVTWAEAAPIRPDSTDVPWAEAAPLRPGDYTMPWRDGQRVRYYEDFPWRDGQRVAYYEDFPWRGVPATLYIKRSPWRDGEFVETHGNNPWPPVVPPEVDPCYDASPDLLFGELVAVDGRLLFKCDYSTPSTGPTASVVVPIRSAYIVVNNISLTLLGGAVLPTLRLGMALDSDSWTWRWSATLRNSALGMIDTGGPVEVIANINGASFRLVIEQISRSRTFGAAEVTVSGRGRNSVLDVLSLDHANTDVRTAAQLMDDALALHSPWNVEFNLDDWLVPANVWSFQGTAMEALRAIAGAAGGYIQPHRTLQTVRVLPKYEVAPWDWGGVTPDFELPSAVTQREGVEWVSKPEYNRVYVSGVRDGILAQVTRDGTAGDILAPMVTDALITEAPAGRQRGLAILGDTGRQALLSLSLPVLPETGVIEPGAFIRYVDGASTRIGVVRSTTIDGNLPTLRQTLGVETHA